MNRILLGTGNFGWDAVERRSDRYGAFHLSNEDDSPVLLDAALDDLEGKYGQLVAEVLVPVKSTHMGDLYRKLKPSMPEKGEMVILGEGSLFIEHLGLAIHEKASHERKDDEILKALERIFNSLNIVNTQQQVELGSEIYDIVGLKPLDGRETDWLDPKSFYRLHCSKIKLFFEEI